jgi:large subunit ribosomal protein L25
MSEIKAFVLAATVRQEKGKQVQSIRTAGGIPAVVYGHNVKNIELTLRYRDFEKIYAEAGSSSLIDLHIEGGKPIKILIQEVQRDPRSGKYIHADFHQVKMTEKINAEITLNFIGESKAVKELGAILVKNLSTISIECLPQDLVHEIPVDISRLQTIDDSIRVSDLPIPSGISIKEKGEEVVANVQPPRSEEELKSLEEKPEEKIEDVSQVEKKKKEDEASEEALSGATTASEEKKKEEKK